jgi:hypothetical protein
MNQAAVLFQLPGMEGFFQSVEHEAGVHRVAHPPAHVRRAYTSITKATYSDPCQVLT